MSSRSTERRGGIATADSGTKVLVRAPQISDMLNDTLFAIRDVDEKSTRTETVRRDSEEGPISFDVRRDAYTGRDGHSNDGTTGESPVPLRKSLVAIPARDARRGGIALKNNPSCAAGCQRRRLRGAIGRHRLALSTQDNSDLRLPSATHQSRRFSRAIAAQKN